MKRSALPWLAMSDVLALHELAMSVAEEGLDGVKDPGWLESALMAPRNAYVSTLAELGAVVVASLAKGHGFHDGNKRTALLAGLTFLSLATGEVVRGRSRTVDLVVGLAAGTHTVDDMANELGELMGMAHTLEDE